ncbi:hypothetical protein [Pedosphaera parvula]|uniref:hypothetical protein n=1 Tax=Pedosphaera parvula TaxID=1032527 RepID=UPI000A008199|nr:hypothetical protein [Pedosphaera parvula]
MGVGHLQFTIKEPLRGETEQKILELPGYAGTKKSGRSGHEKAQKAQKKTLLGYGIPIQVTPFIETYRLASQKQVASDPSGYMLFTKGP